MKNKRLLNTSALLLALVAASAQASELSFNDNMGDSSSSAWNFEHPEAIIGGTDVSSGDPVASSTVLIYGQENGSGFICTGSIIAQDIIITAAHCLGDSGNAKLVVAFRTDINGQGPVFQVTQQTRPADYATNSQRSATDWDDLGLLQIANPLPTGYAPAKLLTDRSAIRNGANILLAGYGINVPTPPTDQNNDGGAGVLRKVTQVVLNANYGKTETLVSLKGKGACHGDSGGPAFVQSGSQLLLFGVTSRLTSNDKVAGNGNAQDYSCSVDMVYTNMIARSAWINSTIANFHSQASKFIR